MLSHCIVSPLFSPKVRILRKGRLYVFGRDQKADFRLPSEIVSRRHAELEWDKPRAGFLLRDLGSKNGSRVNDVPVVEPVILRDGDRISIGPFSLSYREYKGDISQLLEEGDAAEVTAAITREALEAARSGAAAGFAGNFTGQELLEIARLLGFGEKDGVLTVDGGALKGQIFFEQGEIRRANAGELRGERAAQELLSLPSGRFEFVSGAVPGDRTCRIRVEGIAMEVARRIDERGISPAVPPLAPDQSGSSTMTGIQRLDDSSSRGTRDL